MFRTILIALVLVITGNGMLFAAPTSSLPTVELPKAVHFLTPGGEDIVIGPGTFEVEAMEQGLRLRPREGKEGKTIEALTIPHGEQLAAPKAVSEAIGDDTLRIALLLPEGKRLEITGSYSGVRTRGGAYNTSYGTQALASNTTGSNNAAFGTEALRFDTTGRDNTATGALALLSTTTGGYNTAMGSDSMRLNTTGGSNTAVGARALYWNQVAGGNTAIGFEALHKNITSGNTAVGSTALSSNTAGSRNVAIGEMALSSNSTGGANTGAGWLALNGNQSGQFNTAIGSRALASNQSGNSNTVLGADALKMNTGSAHGVAVGFQALGIQTAGIYNTAIGSQALGALATGDGNIAVGSAAGNGLTQGSGNIYIGAGLPAPASTESNTIRIGTNTGVADPLRQDRAFIAGIHAVAVTGTPVVVTPQGQLGIQVSSMRYKEDIRDLGKTSHDVLKLRPVSFRYKADTVAGTGDRSREYGLIAEEVAALYPDLVTRTDNGEVLTVRYDQLVPLLLNELQRQHRKNEELEARLAKLEGK